MGAVGTVGLRELRQDASELLRRVERGEEFTITVAGRPSARLVAAGRGRWVGFEAVAELFEGPSDPAWDTDRERVDQTLGDPWSDA